MKLSGFLIIIYISHHPKFGKNQRCLEIGTSCRGGQSPLTIHYPISEWPFQSDYLFSPILRRRIVYWRHWVEGQDCSSPWRRWRNECSVGGAAQEDEHWCSASTRATTHENWRREYETTKARNTIQDGLGGGSDQAILVEESSVFVRWNQEFDVSVCQSLCRHWCTHSGC